MISAVAIFLNFCALFMACVFGASLDEKRSVAMFMLFAAIVFFCLGNGLFLWVQS